jgi:thiol-disulfide isomerase/thioredoxin
MFQNKSYLGGWMKHFFSVCLISLLIANSQAETSLTPISGENITFSSLKGKWVLINYWADWCHTCVQEIPELNQFFRDNKNKNVALFGFNFDELPISTQQQLVKKHRILFPNLAKNPAKELALGDIPGVPVTFVFNPAGKLVNTLYGGQSAADLELAIAE